MKQIHILPVFRTKTCKEKKQTKYYLFHNKDTDYYLFHNKFAHHKHSQVFRQTDLSKQYRAFSIPIGAVWSGSTLSAIHLHFWTHYFIVTYNCSIFSSPEHEFMLILSYCDQSLSVGIVSVCPSIHNFFKHHLLCLLALSVSVRPSTISLNIIFS